MNGIFSSSPFFALTPEKSFLYSSIGGSPHDCGVSRSAHQQNIARRSATEAEVLPEEWAKATGATKGYEVLVDVQDKKDILHYGMDVLVVVK